MARTREELSAQLDELKPALTRTLAAQHAKVSSQGKPWDMVGWMLGEPISHKYPSGPAYEVRASHRQRGWWRGGASARRERAQRHV